MDIIKIPEGVKLELGENTLRVSGKLGKVEKSFNPRVRITVNGSEIIIEGEELAQVNTSISHINNMIKGVREGYEIQMKIVYAHFPITVEVKGKDIIIKNFLGEKQPRKTVIAGELTKVQAKGQLLSITGPDKEAVGQTASNIRLATKIKEKDSRVFQDGFYIC